MTALVLMTALSAADPITIEREVRVGEHLVRIYAPGDAGRDDVGDRQTSFAILREEQPLFASAGDHRYYLGADIDDRHGAEWLVPGARLLGPDSDPCVVIEGWSGGAHCCYTLWIFQLGRWPRHVDTVPLHHGGWRLVDLDHDGDAEIECRDWTYAYHWTSFAASPAPRIVLRKGGDGYGFVLAPDLMRRAAPPATELDAAAARARTAMAADAMTDEYAGDLHRVMLDLLYTGHPALAWEHLERCWSRDRSAMRAFGDEFVRTLRRSDHWPALERLWGLGRPLPGMPRP